MATVLIVDDNPLDRRMAAGFVQQEGLATLFAENGRDAIRVLGEQSILPDIVLTDLDMPEMNGLLLVREVQRLFPTIPVILMTAHGSEEIAAAALKQGASSYVAKRRFNRDLGPTLRQTLGVAESMKARQLVFQFLEVTESHFKIGYEERSRVALTSYFQDLLRTMNLCESDQELLRIGTALNEALLNSLEHGNLELSSSLRETENGRPYYELAAERMKLPPYRDRRVRVTIRLTTAEARFIIADEGPGFDPNQVPDPTNPENLMLVHGRGLMLIQTFMDHVSFNAAGNEITLIYRKPTNAPSPAAI